jgi:hypothetical protein
MSVSDGQAVNAAITNAAFISRTVNSSTVANIQLLASGLEPVTNLQSSVNASRKIERATQTITGGGVIEYLEGIGFQNIPIQSGSGEVLTAAIALSGVPMAGMMIKLIGLSDTNYVKLVSNDTDEGLILNGDCLLLRFTTITLEYWSGLDRWVEVCRNI